MDASTSVGQPGAQSAGAVAKNLYADMFGGLKISFSGMRFYELNRMGLLYTVGSQDNALVAANAVSTLTSSAQPIIGLFNPLGSGVDLVLLKTSLLLTTIGGTAVNPLGFFYTCGTAAANPISTGTANGGINCKTLLKAGSQATTFTGGATALTGLVTSLSVLAPVGIPPVINAVGPATAISLPQYRTVDMVEGAIIVKQGQFLGVQNGTDVSLHASNVSASFTWGELPTVSGS